MQKRELNYVHRPAFLDTAIVCLLCTAIVIALATASEVVSHEVSRQILREIELPQDSVFWRLAYGRILAIPFLAVIVTRILWNLMTVYKITPTSITLLTGTLVRREYYYSVFDFDEVSFEQHIVDAMLGIGTLKLVSSRKGQRLVIYGVYRVGAVAEALRPNLGQSRPVSEGLPKGTETVSREPRSSASVTTGARPGKTVVVHKGGGCLGCLILMLVVILLPIFVGAVFKIAVFAALLEVLRQLVGSIQQQAGP